MTCKYRPRYDLSCVWWDIKPCSINLQPLDLCIQLLIGETSFEYKLFSLKSPSTTVRPSPGQVTSRHQHVPSGCYQPADSYVHSCLAVSLAVVSNYCRHSSACTEFRPRHFDKRRRRENGLGKNSADTGRRFSLTHSQHASQTPSRDLLLDLMPWRRRCSPRALAAQVAYNAPPLMSFLCSSGGFSERQLQSVAVLLDLVYPLLPWSSLGSTSGDASMKSCVMRSLHRQNVKLWGSKLGVNGHSPFFDVLRNIFFYFLTVKTMVFIAWDTNLPLKPHI